MTNTRSPESLEAREPGAYADAEPTAPIADLAEEVVELISEADQDWRTIERRVRQLLELVGGRRRWTPAPFRSWR